MSTTIIYVYAYIILVFPITYRNVSVLCQSYCNSKHGSFLYDEIPTQKGEQSWTCTELSLKQKVWIEQITVYNLLYD